MGDYLWALTVCQPWAWAIMDGPKRWENRSWSTNYRGPLLIHAGKSKTWLREGLAFLGAQGLTVPSDLPMGALLGLVTLADVRNVRTVTNDPFAFGPECWNVDRPSKLERPIPYRGSQGLFRVPITSELKNLLAAYDHAT